MNERIVLFGLSSIVVDHMSSRKDLIIQKYGPSDDYRLELQEDDLDSENEPMSMDIFRLSVYHMKLSLSDGLLHLINIPDPSPSQPFLYIGSAGSAYNQDALLNAQVSHIICLTSLVKSAFPDHFRYLRVNMRDNHSENLNERFMECYPFIEEARRDGGRVLIHCYKGQSRSAAIICAYLIYCHPMEVNQALKLIQLARPIAQPNNHFMSSLYQLYESRHSHSEDTKS
jgi:protein-tyrosine phosphatase